MRRLTTSVTNVEIPSQRERMDIHAFRPRSDLADVTDPPDSGDFADWHPHPLAPMPGDPGLYLLPTKKGGRSQCILSTGPQQGYPEAHALPCCPQW